MLIILSSTVFFRFFYVIFSLFANPINVFETTFYFSLQVTIDGPRDMIIVAAYLSFYETLRLILHSAKVIPHTKSVISVPYKLVRHSALCEDYVTLWQALNEIVNVKNFIFQIWT